MPCWRPRSTEKKVRLYGTSTRTRRYLRMPSRSPIQASGTCKSMASISASSSGLSSTSGSAAALTWASMHNSSIRAPSAAAADFLSAPMITLVNRLWIQHYASTKLLQRSSFCYRQHCAALLHKGPVFVSHRLAIYPSLITAKDPSWPLKNLALAAAPAHQGKGDWTR
ncbi:hypothetical protein FQZ97_917140 [compost metagenome]